MDSKRGWTLRERVIAAGAVALMLVLHGAVPFLMTPTVGQAVWSMGFAQSFANGPLTSIHAHDFGIPKPAAIAFGLAGAWPASLLIRLGLHSADAYAGIAALWLAVAFGAAYKIARMFGAQRIVSLLGAVAWTSMPIIWAHAGYSTLSLGIGLLPLYFLAALRLFQTAPDARQARVSALVYCLATFVAVFMDGYTFMMFATGASILLAHALISRPDLRRMLVRFSLPVHVASFALSYVLFSAYIGKSNFDAAPIEFFRGWGLDLAFVAIPSEGSHWLPDLLGLSVKRSDATYFGDASVWMTTFSLPVILAGLAAWRPVRKQASIATGALLVAAFGFYMALGPSLKINSTKPESIQVHYPGPESSSMPPALAVMATGNAWLSEEVPGFNVMRASYRWSALGIFALWLLVMLRVAHVEKDGRRIWAAILLGVTLLNLPSMPKKWQNGRDARTMFQQIDQSLVSELRLRIRKGETVAFLPWGNDFMANYVAPTVGFRTFNIGGDKNLAAAQAQWPRDMLALRGDLGAGNAAAAVRMLADGTADVLVVPYFHMLWAPHLWPCPDETTATLTAAEAESFRRIPGFVCPSKRKEQLEEFVAAARALPAVDVSESYLFATIRLHIDAPGVRTGVARR